MKQCTVHVKSWRDTRSCARVTGDLGLFLIWNDALISKGTDDGAAKGNTAVILVKQMGYASMGAGPLNRSRCNRERR
jgi:hypothetical protein